MTKSVDKGVVLSTSTSLIAKNGKTTTLEIKEFLRDSGYRVCQEEVSRFVKEIALEEGYDFTDNGTYRTYTSSTLKTSLTTNPTIVSARVTGTVSSPSTGDWEMNSTFIKTILYFDKNLTRDQARQAYCSQTGVKWHCTRGRRVK
jgi:hypothetical protein